MKTKVLSTVAALVMFVDVTATTSASAAPVTLSYLGNPYTTISDPTLGTSLTGNITFDQLPSGALCSPCSGIESWSFTSGNYTLDQTNSSLALVLDFLFAGYAGWEVNVISIVGALAQQVEFSTFSPISGPGLGTINNDYNSAFFVFNGPGNYVDYRGPTYPAPGAWTIEAATPLPSTWLMLLSGLVGLGFVARRGTKKGRAAFAAA
jgi:hypothetical protein